MTGGGSVTRLRGRKLNAEVSRVVMGRTTCGLCPHGAPIAECVHVAPFGSDMTAAWKVVKVMDGLMSFTLRNTNAATVICEFGNHVAEANRAELAICWAALDAMRSVDPDRQPRAGGQED